jgi:hypothetical protein
MKGKPVRFGIKIWALASSSSRYVSNVLVYLGVGDVREEDDLLGADAVLQAVRGLEGRGHTIITDNFFSSVKLFRSLLERGFYATGTVKIVAVVWIHSKPMWLLSTATNSTSLGTVAQRWIRRDMVDFPTSPVLLQYQANMRGVDVVDQYRHYYTAMLNSHKWWHKCLTFIVGSSLLNCFIIYREDATELGLGVWMRQLFHLTLAKALVAPLVCVNVHRG